MNIVIGSGPAGISCAMALLEGGGYVTMIDAGQTLEQPALSKVERLVELGPHTWPYEANFLKKDFDNGTSGIPLKLAYGSDYPYRRTPGATPIICEGSEAIPSYAQGGLSNVWGSSVLPYRDQDIVGWPIDAAALEPGYRAVSKWMPIAGRHDDLEASFPLFETKLQTQPMSNQARLLLNDLEAHRSQLNHQGIIFGTSRLAMKADASVEAPGCVACGLCMYGCPYQLIYSSRLTLHNLIGNPRFMYLPGLTVKRVEEKEDIAIAHAVTQHGNTETIKGERIFVGAGTLETTSILLRSYEKYDEPVTLLDSQYFLVPFLRKRGAGNVLREGLHTLAQIFLELTDHDISPHTVHLQAYTYNELFRDALRSSLRQAKHVFPQQAFLSRLLIIQGFLHSSQSMPVSATLKLHGEHDELVLKAMPNAETPIVVRKLLRKLGGVRSLTGMLPLMPMLRTGMPGRSFHTGGTFPMKARPGPGDTDIYGRPFGMTRIHAVDSSIFPTIPATTITFTVMANAYRIGSSLPSYA